MPTIRLVNEHDTTSGRDLWELLDVAAHYGDRGIDGYLKRILQGCQRWFSASAVSLFLKQEGGDYKLAGQYGRSARVPDGAILRAGDGIAGSCIAAGTPMLIENPIEHPLLVGKVERPRGDVASSMVVPLITPESDCVGVLNLSRKSGEPFFTSEDLLKASSLAGHIALAASNARLVSQLNSAVGEARRLHAQLEGILDGLSVGVVVVGADGAIREFNPEAAALANAPEQGKWWSEFVSEAASRLRAALDEALVDGLAGKRTNRMAKDSASDTAWSINCSPLPSGDVAVVIQDVTVLEKAERELSRMNRLAEIGQMTAAIAHEIRNPLTGIRTSAQMVINQGGESAEFGQIIQEEALKLNDLCDQFLDFARPLHLRVQDSRPADVIRHVLAQSRREIEKRGVKIDLDCGPWEPVIPCDPLRFEQIFRNLLINALDVSKQGSTITIRLDDIGLSVEDQGPGIPPEVREKLFTPFFTTKPHGTGLGLSNVRKIAEAHGWDVGVSRPSTGGTRMEISFYGEKAA